jgi:hypothetical protein
MPLAPYAIRWGLDASSNLLRERARCTRCGHLGATLMHPSPSLDEHGWYRWPEKKTFEACASMHANAR